MRPDHITVTSGHGNIENRQAAPRLRTDGTRLVGKLHAASILSVSSSCQLAHQGVSNERRCLLFIQPCAKGLKNNPFEIRIHPFVIRNPFEIRIDHVLTSKKFEGGRGEDKT